MMKELPDQPPPSRNVRLDQIDPAAGSEDLRGLAEEVEGTGKMVQRVEEDEISDAPSRKGQAQGIRLDVDEVARHDIQRPAGARLEPALEVSRPCTDLDDRSRLKLVGDPAIPALVDVAERWLSLSDRFIGDKQLGFAVCRPDRADFGVE
jgi:hypothetical protein